MELIDQHPAFHIQYISSTCYYTKWMAMDSPFMSLLLKYNITSDKNGIFTLKVENSEFHYFTTNMIDSQTGKTY